MMDVPTAESTATARFMKIEISNFFLSELLLCVFDMSLNCTFAFCKLPADGTILYSIANELKLLQTNCGSYINSH